MSSHHTSTDGLRSHEKKTLEHLLSPVPLSEVFEIPDISAEEVQSRLSQFSNSFANVILTMLKRPEVLPEAALISDHTLKKDIDEIASTLDSLSPNAAYAAAMKEMAKGLRESIKSYEQDSKHLDK